MGIGGIVFENHHLVAVESIEAVLGPDPNKTTTILERRLGRDLGQTLRQGQSIQFNPLAGVR